MAGSENGSAAGASFTIGAAGASVTGGASMTFGVSVTGTAGVTGAAFSMRVVAAGSSGLLISRVDFVSSTLAGFVSMVSTTAGVVDAFDGSTAAPVTGAVSTGFFDSGVD